MQEQSLTNILNNSSSLREMLTCSIQSQLLQQQQQLLLSSSFIAPASLSATVQPRAEQGLFNKLFLIFKKFF